MRLDYSDARIEKKRAPIKRSHLATAVIVATCAGLVFTSRPGEAKRSVLPAHNGVLTIDLSEAVTDNGLEYDGDSNLTDATTALLSTALSSDLKVPNGSDWETVKVKSGQSLSAIFDQLGIQQADCRALLNTPEDTSRLIHLRVGDLIQIKKDGDRLNELKLAIDESRTLHIQRDDDKISVETIKADIERREAVAFGTIDGSLYASANRAGVSDRIVMEMSKVFAYDVDWALDIRKGDRFTLVYDQLYREGKKLRDGELIAAEFITQGRVLRAVRYTDKNGDSAFYTPAGKSLKTSFIRTPLDITRVTSHFNPNRRHPVLNKLRAHKGTDYAAGTGTPIKTTGDGKVAFVGNKGGYGRVVIIKHANSYQTLYAHMSRFASGMRVGKRVRQGQIIGYVGQSGLATGPHLHFEFLVNGTHKNPVTVALPRANPVPRNEMLRFNAQSGVSLAKLDTVARTQFALHKQ